jgi:hypothetical protein
MTQSADDALLDWLQRGAFAYLWQEANPTNGLVADSTWPGTPASIAAVGFALAAYPVGVERGFVPRAAAAERTLATLRFFWAAPHGPQPDATGYQGFYYHFLDLQTGRRAGLCELSTIDTACLLAGVLVVAQYFDQATATEREIRHLADALYRRADWPWAQNGGLTVTHGWQPESGFLPYRWEGYNEALFLYILGLGSPTHPLPAASYPAWTATYQWRRIYGTELVHAGPLFIHQFSHLFLDLRGITDQFMAAKGIDYFENSRRSTYVQQQYAIRNPQQFVGYGEWLWGITASEGPGPATRAIDGRAREFWGYMARGVPDGPDDGTISPWVVISALPFAPEIVLPTLAHIQATYPQLMGEYGFTCTLNPTFADATGAGRGWFSQHYYGLNEGPIVVMIENYRSALIWRRLRQCAYVVAGLRRAGFRQGWLAAAPGGDGARAQAP